MIYRTVQNDVIDHVIWKHYDGRQDVLETVMSVNPFLCEQPVKLPEGLLITLPRIQKQDTHVITVVD